MHNRCQKTILIVEDDQNDQMFFLAAFHSIGVQDPIHLTNSGSEAIAYLRGEGRFADRVRYAYPTFLITDLKMPHGDGFTVLEHLRRHSERPIIPTVVFTSSDDPDDVKRAYFLGANCYHRKPTGYGELQAQLRILYDYWITCLVPEVDVTGTQLETRCAGKLGERFGQGLRTI